MRKNNLIGEKNLSQLSASDVTHVVSLDTNKQALVYEESGELWEVCYLLLLLLIDFVDQMVFILFCQLVTLEIIFKRFYSPDNYPFPFVPHWTLIVCSLVFEWCNPLGILNDAQSVVFAECTFVSIQFLLLNLWSSILNCIERWWWRSSVAAFVLQL